MPTTSIRTGDVTTNSSKNEQVMKLGKGFTRITRHEMEEEKRDKLFQLYLLLLYGPTRMSKYWGRSGNDEVGVIVELLESQIEERMSSLSEMQIPQVWKTMLNLEKSILACYLNRSEQRLIYTMAIAAHIKMQPMKTWKVVTRERELKDVWTLLLDKKKRLLVSFLGYNSVDYSCLQSAIISATQPMQYKKRIKVHPQYSYTDVRIHLRRKFRREWEVLLHEKKNILKDLLGDGTEDWANLMELVGILTSSVTVKKRTKPQVQYYISQV